jgi:hypothetical protein
VVVFGQATGAEVRTKPFFDPTNSRVHS